MRCLATAIGSSLSFAYAHHIQRLMVTGNCALLTGIDPAEVDRWYLGIYIDAFDWVERSNTRGMALYADGGRLASKPYCSSGKYIQRMSDHCPSCTYRVADTEGEESCPFNSLYWNFIAGHRHLWERNPRMAFPLRSWDRFTPERRSRILARAERVLEGIENL